jgi:Set1/Ash2 histone methyltransferase complex subunit ASH2
MCLTVMANLTQGCVKDGSNKQLFSKDKDLIPYLEMHWDALTTTTRRVTSSWHSTVFNSNIFFII